MSHPLRDLAHRAGAHASGAANALAHVVATTAPTAAGASAGTSADTVSITSLLFQLVVGLGVVLGAIALVAKVVRGRAGLTLGPGRRQGALAVIGRQGLSKGTSVAIVRAGTRVFVLGVTPQSVRSLGELDPDEFDPLGAGATAAETIDGGNATVATFPTTKQRPTTTWTSTIEQLREMTVRRA